MAEQFTAERNLPLATHCQCVGFQDGVNLNKLPQDGTVINAFRKQKPFTLTGGGGGQGEICDDVICEWPPGPVHFLD